MFRSILPAVFFAPALALTVSCTAETAPDEPTQEAEEAAATGPKAVIKAYYDAISQRDFDTAWQLWGQDPKADPDAFQTFMRGFAETELTAVEIGEMIDVGIKDDFAVVTVPVNVEDLMSDGTGRSYSGVYTLRRPASSAGDWHIESGDLDIAPSAP
ncbi:hypothetical protein KCG44_07580 [Pacificimonas sp. WHA3]|uniref:DUF4440 domain-containing protein n=1 Tax=Pacificimonas pallii TaxID=2827236 RepID=A0ABS6SE07_9SPHN|nr:hypothetical protein [Pacificimonas pallii]MBV7256644.1 hypothetical protein [Pacificimonas pallii]